MDGWNTSFLLGWPIFRGYVSFRANFTLSAALEPFLSKVDPEAVKYELQIHLSLEYRRKTNGWIAQHQTHKSGINSTWSLSLSKTGVDPNFWRKHSSILYTLQETNISHLGKRKIIDSKAVYGLYGRVYGIWDSSQEGMIDQAPEPTIHGKFQPPKQWIHDTLSSRGLQFLRSFCNRYSLQSWLREGCGNGMEEEQWETNDAQKKYISQWNCDIDDLYLS